MMYEEKPAGEISGEGKCDHSGFWRKERASKSFNWTKKARPMGIVCGRYEGGYGSWQVRFSRRYGMAQAKDIGQVGTTEHAAA
jgi:hypothetical protein